MEKILGLDLGVSSIGWAVVEKSQKSQILIDAGVRIIPIDSKRVEEFSKGNATSANAERRIKRSMRRNLHRYRLRKHKLIQYLTQLQIWPIDKTLFKMNAIELYGVRDKAVKEQISLNELVRIWFHLNQKRGYYDSRKNIDKTQDSDYQRKIQERGDKIRNDGFKTIGSFFYHQLKNNSKYRIKVGKGSENIFLMEQYRDEFDKIWDTQSKFYAESHPHIFNETVKNELRDKIIYYKRKLKSQKLLISDCRLEKFHKCMPVSSPVAVEFRIWQDINNLVIIDTEKIKRTLTIEQKKDLFDFLNHNNKISEKEIIKRYYKGISSKEFVTNFPKGIIGNVFYDTINKIFNKYKFDWLNIDDFDVCDVNFSQHKYFKLWHLLYATEENKDIRKTLKENPLFQFPEIVLDEVCKVTLKNDFASLCSRAARKILPYLRNGEFYYQAVTQAGYKHKQEDTPILIPVQKLPQIYPNSLRNPTVEKILNQLINLLKSLDLKGYKFDEIRVELARELKNNAVKRKRIFENNKKNENERKEIIRKLTEKHGLLKVSNKDIEKYKLWEEFDGVSPYEPGKRIEIGDLLDANKYEIEHIIPKSRYFDDSFMNKTIARVYINQQEKKEQTAFDYMQTKPDEIFQQYMACIRDAKIPNRKREYLTMRASEIPNDFINRQLNETQYIATETIKVLKNICAKVHSTTGAVTRYLRHYWGYDDIIMELNMARVSQEDIVWENKNGNNKKFIKGWNKRLDHRHHALDAIVIAATQQSFIQQLNTLNATYEENKPPQSVNIRSSIPFQREHVKGIIDNILISFKAGKRVASLKIVKKDRWGKEPGNWGQKTYVPRGALHKESIYGKNLYYQKIPIKKLKTINSLAVNDEKNIILNHLKNYNGILKDALNNLGKDPILYPDKTELNVVTIFIERIVIRYSLEYTSNKIDSKFIESIVDKGVQKVLKNRLKENGDDYKKAFTNIIDNPIWLNKEKGINIETVRCYVKNELETESAEEQGYVPLHSTHDGLVLNEQKSSILENAKPVNYVKPGNNHHIALYRNNTGEIIEECVTFFDAFELRKTGLSVINKKHPLGYQFLVSIQQNEMFVFGLTIDELKRAISENNFSLISKHLYRTQKLASKNYVFRHHLETILDDTKQAHSLGKFIRIRTPKSFTGIKVKILMDNSIQLIID